MSDAFAVIPVGLHETFDTACDLRSSQSQRSVRCKKLRIEGKGRCIRQACFIGSWPSQWFISQVYFGNGCYPLRRIHIFCAIQRGTNFHCISMRNNLRRCMLHSHPAAKRGKPYQPVHKLERRSGQAGQTDAARTLHFSELAVVANRKLEEESKWCIRQLC